MKKYNFSEELQQVLQAAEDTAADLMHAHILPAHLLVALIEGHNDAVDNWFHLHNIDTNKIISIVKKDLEVLENLSEGDELEVSESTRDVMRLAGVIAVQSEEEEVTPLHLLMAVLDDADEIVTSVFSAVGIDISKLDDILYIEELKRSYVEDKSTLMKYGVNISALVEKRQIVPFTDKWSITDDFIEILSRDIKNVPVIVGSFGIARDALAEGLAARISSGDVPDKLSGNNIIHIMINPIIANSKDLNDFVAILRQIISEAENYNNIILYFDELYPDFYKMGTIDILLLLKPALGRRNIKIIGCSEKPNIKSYIQQDLLLDSKVEIVKIHKVSEARASEILNNYRETLEALHNVKVKKVIFEYAYATVKRYITTEQYLEETINLLDMAATRVHLKNINNGQHPVVIKKTDIDEIVARIIGIPRWRVSRDKRYYDRIEERLHEHVIGQEEAVNSVVNVIKMKENYFNLNPNLPDGIFLFVGPRGVGKKEFIKSLAQILYDDEERVTYFDMKQYNERESILDFLGFHDKSKDDVYPSVLTGAIKEYPYSILFLDEINQTAPEVRNLLLEIFKTGMFEDNFGNKVFFKGITIVMTVKAYEEQKKQLGFLPGSKTDYNVEMIHKGLETMLGADMLHTIDQIVVFKELSSEHMNEIIRKRLFDRLREKLPITWSVEQSAIDFLKNAVDQEPEKLQALERVFQKHVFSFLAIHYYKDDLCYQNKITIRAKNGELQFV